MSITVPGLAARLVLCVLALLLADSALCPPALADELAQAAQPAYRPVTPFDPDYILNYPRALIRVLGWPLRLDERSYVVNGLVAGTTLALMFADGPVHRFTQDRRNAVTDRVSGTARHFGEAPLIGGGLGAAYLIGDRRMKETALLGIQALAVSGVVGGGLKALIGRPRPSHARNAFDFADPDDGSSFPSGHTVAAVTTATVIAEEYKDRPLVGTLAYGVAALTGYSRINDNKHWTSDVFFSAALGYGVGKLVTRMSPFREDSPVRIEPRLAENGGGLALRVQF
ncbi:MAG: phosphatase PAP2 family protein [Proteobacteria bacterium]|nr:phosphatase PAP2 family protein [Pseudomonadota bacterium]